MDSVQQTAAIVVDRTRGLGEHLAWYAKEHPIRMAVTVGAVGWLLLRRRERVNEWQGVAETSWDDEAHAPFPADSASLREKVGELATTARETVGQYASTARETAGEYVGSARRASKKVRNAAGTASSSVDTFVRGNPLAAGAVALAVGAAIGLLIPRTAFEDRTMGETRDQAVARAGRVARELTDRVAERAQSVAESVVAESFEASRFGSGSPTVGRA